MSKLYRPEPTPNRKVEGLVPGYGGGSSTLPGRTKSLQISIFGRTSIGGQPHLRCPWSHFCCGTAVTATIAMMGAVPTISRFFGISIAMFFDDHGYPHFHARHADEQAKVRIDNLEVIETTLDRRHLRLVLAWAELHQAGETLQEIEPLR